MARNRIQSNVAGVNGALKRYNIQTNLS